MPKLIDRPRKYFEDIAKRRNGVYNPPGSALTGFAFKIQKNVFELIYGISDLFDFTMVLEVGSGPGRYLDLYKDRVSEAVLVDFSVGMLHLARLRSRRLGIATRVDLVAADMASLPFREETFTTVMCIDTLHHVAKGDKKAIFSGLCNMVSRGGHIVIELKNRFFPLYVTGIPQRRNPVGISVPDNIYEIRKLAIMRAFRIISAIGVTPWGRANALISPSCLIVATKERTGNLASPGIVKR